MPTRIGESLSVGSAHGELLAVQYSSEGKKLGDVGRGRGNLHSRIMSGKYSTEAFEWIRDKVGDMSVA